MKKLRGSTIVMISVVTVIVGFIVIFNVILVGRSSFHMEFKEARIINGLANSTIEPMEVEVVGELIEKKFDIGELWKSNAIVGSTRMGGAVNINGKKHKVLLVKSVDGSLQGYLRDENTGKIKFEGYLLLDQDNNKVCLFDYKL